MELNRHAHAASRATHRARRGLALVWGAAVLAGTTAILATVAPQARADGPFDGSWNMSAITETFTVQQWSTACGPAPQSDTLIPGGPVTVTGSGGELVIAGSRTLRTDQCLDPLPTLARAVHSQDATSWRTRCASPTSDPRHATVNTAYFVTSPTSISIAETGRYEFTIDDAHCIADVKRAGSLSRSAAAAATAADTATATATAPAVAPTPPPVSTPPPNRPDCSSPGDPARLEVRPSRKLLKLGDTFSFQGAVLDASGCNTGTAVQWSVGPVTFQDGQPHTGLPTIDATGKLTVPTQDFASATFDVLATIPALAGQAGGKTAHAGVQATSPGDYDALLAQSGLDSKGERDEPAVAILATSSIGGGDAQAKDTARKRRFVFVGIVASLGILLGIVALVAAGRGKRRTALAQSAADERHAEKMRDFERHKGEREAKHAAQTKAYLEAVAIAQQQAAAATARGVDTGPVFCPSCRREYPAGMGFCMYDANRLVAARGHEDIRQGPPGGVCPTCRRGVNPGVKVCPQHGDPVVPSSVLGPPAQSLQGRGAICPKCGSRSDGAAPFCGRDGTELAPVN